MGIINYILVIWLVLFFWVWPLTEQIAKLEQRIQILEKVN